MLSALSRQYDRLTPFTAPGLETHCACANQSQHRRVTEVRRIRCSGICSLNSCAVPIHVGKNIKFGLSFNTEKARNMKIHIWLQNTSYCGKKLVVFFSFDGMMHNLSNLLIDLCTFVIQVLNSRSEIQGRCAEDYNHRC